MSTLTRAFARMGGLLALGVAASATATPLNDAWNDRIAIPAVASGTPFSTSEGGAAFATSEAGDPATPCNAGPTGVPGAGTNSLWYSYTTGAQAEYVNLSTQGTYYYTGVNSVTGQLNTTLASIAVFTGTPGSFRLVAGGCNSTIAGHDGYALIGGLRLEAQTTYSFEVTAASALSTVNPPPAPATSMPTLAFAVSAAPIYTVDRLDDPLPAAATCSTGNCTIRAAVNAANAAPGAIMIPAGTYAMTATTTNEDANADGDFDVASSVSIYGAGRGQTIIQAPTNDRVFDFISPLGGASGTGMTNHLVDLSLIGPGNPASGGSGTFTFGGGLLRARGTSYLGLAALERVELAQAYTTNFGDSGSFQAGGAAQFAAHGQVIDCDIHDNTGRNGGGLAVVFGAPFEIRGSLIHDNLATNPLASTGSAANGGGGIQTGTPIALIDSTLANNRANGDGGGFSFGAIGNATAPKTQIRNTTIAGNRADADGDGIGAGGGLRISRTAGINAYHNILYGNASGIAAVADDCTGATPAAASPTLTAYNMVGSASGAACAFTSGNHDQIGVDPLLAPLADNGGPTRTFALSAGSPAIDAGDPAGCADNNGLALAVDQRGFARAAGLRCDIGAFERVGAIAAPSAPMLDAASDSGVSSADNLTNLTSPSIDGVCAMSPANYLLALVVDGIAAGSVNCAGAPFQTVIGPLPDGMHRVTAYAVDADGAPSPQSAALALTIDTLTSVAITSGPADPSSSPAAAFEISAESGDALTCTLDSAASAPCTSPVNYANLGGGNHVFAVEASDAAGNHAIASFAWTIAAPSAPGAPMLDAASDTGESGSDGITHAQALAFHGDCAQDGDIIQLFDGSTPAGASATCAASAYVASIDGLDEGVHAISANARRGGVAGTSSPASTITIDRTAPMAPVVTTPASPVPPTFTLAGTAEAGTSVAIAQGSTLLCSMVADAGGTWTCSVTPAGSGPIALSLTATDVAGNRSAETSWSAGSDVLLRDGFDGN